MDPLPPNSKRSQGEAKQHKKIEQVAGVEAKKRKTPLGRRFKDTFMQGDVKSAAGNAVETVVVPMIRDLVYEAAQNLIQQVIFGQTRNQRKAPPSGLFGRVDYSGASNPTRANPGPKTSSAARARHSFDELVLDNRQGAEEVIDRMMDILSQWEVVSIADLYALVGFEATHTDFKWGWTDLSGAGVDRTRAGGYLLNLPTPKALD
jgi:hypothetical protein